MWTIVDGDPGYRFDFHRWWELQPAVTVFHGTSVENARAIFESGWLLPSTRGHTAGKSFFTTGPRQAWDYSAMGGEVSSGGKAKLPREERVVLVLRLLPSYLKLEGKCTRELFKAIEDLLAHDGGFAQYMDSNGLNFSSKYRIRSDYVVGAFRLAE